jgi:TRAP-type C4-dicarboxylate transport system permease small subunit
MAADQPRETQGGAWAGLIGAVRAIIKCWALLGGAILVALILMTATSATLNLTVGRPFPGDFEIVKHGVAIAVFAFLPYCQLTYSNITVDIFTERMGVRTKSAMVFLSSLIAIAFAILLLRQMWLGMIDYIRYPEYMVSVPIALWTAFPPALASLVLLVVASLITAAESWRGMRGSSAPAA